MAKGIESFRSFHDDLEKNPFVLKDAILRSHHGLETLFKLILEEENPVLLLHEKETVSDLSMRQPAVLAKSVATLDIITKGRIELGLGTGAFWDAIQSWGGTRRTPSEAVAAYIEALQVIRLIWNYGKGRSRVSYQGKHYRLENAQAGPSPYHQISIWTGAFGPRMMNIIGRLSDGWVSPLSTYTSNDETKTRQRQIDESAKKNGRSPESIRRIAQLVGAIDEQARPDKSGKKPFFIHDKSPFVGSVSSWADWLVSSYTDLGLDTFIFWPSVEGDEETQVRIFAEKVVPKVKESLMRS